MLHCLLTRVVEWWILMVRFENNAPSPHVLQNLAFQTPKSEHGKKVDARFAENELARPQKKIAHILRWMFGLRKLCKTCVVLLATKKVCVELALGFPPPEKWYNNCVGISNRAGLQVPRLSRRSRPSPRGQQGPGLSRRLHRLQDRAPQSRGRK